MPYRLFSGLMLLGLLSACPAAPVDPKPNEPPPPAPSTDAGVAVTCDPCTTGMALDEADCSCSDIDECATDNGGCDENAVCENAAVSGDAPLCTCDNGTLGDGLAVRPGPIAAKNNTNPLPPVIRPIENVAHSRFVVLLNTKAPQPRQRFATGCVAY